MRLSTPRFACAGLAVLLASGCGKDAGNGNGTPPPGSVPAPVVSLTASPATITAGGDSTLSWNSTNATACTAGGSWSGAKATSGSEQITNIQATTTYSLTCTGTGGTSVPASATVTANPVVGPASGTADAGPSRTVIAGSTVRLSGEASADPQGDALQYTWTQTAGTAVTLTGANTANPTFTAPSVTTNTPLTFSLTVTDGTTPASAPATVTITVTPLVAGNVLVKGRVTFVRIPFLQATNLGLDYAHPVSRPARGIVVRANNAGTSTQLATGETDSDGNYALSVPQNTSMDLVAVARMSRDGSVPLPRWNFSVANADATTTPYSFTDGSFNSATGVTHDINVPSGLDTSGASTGTRASAPFAVLDTVYAGIQTIVGVAPTTDFPALLLDWAADNPGGETFFDPGSGGSQMIVLSADLSEDTDEFDQHVIAHEFGHYIEHNFSRADNIGGSHGLGDKLDIRVAFGEGFGYAFAAMVLKDPVARDSFVTSGCNNPPTNQCASVFNVETNPPASGNNGNFGCYCSESSVWSLLWDFYDGAADANDNVALGFAPLWDVLVGDQRTTPAFTSIYSFTTALKAAQPAQGAAIDTLVAAQNITVSGMDALGSGETHVPTPVPSAAALPLYTALTAGSPVTVRSSGVADVRHYNKLGNHRYVRYVKSGSASQGVTVTSTGPDPDVLVYRNGTFVLASEVNGNEAFTISTAGTYLFDVYECANGCSTVQGTPGDFDLTVTVN
jgi:hypothetical protein